MGCSLGHNQVHVIDGEGQSGKVDQRGGSAVSKISKRSGDSGFDDEGALISEQKMIQREILSRPVLSAQGRSKPRETEGELLAKLRQEGFISKPIANRAYGVSFEVFTSDMSGPGVARPKPPPRLGKIEERRKRRRNKVMREERILEKLRKLEQKKKVHATARLAKQQSAGPVADFMTGDDNADVQPFDTSVPQASTHDPVMLAEIIQSKEEIATENREKKLRERLEKIQMRREHAAEVRRRKREAAAAEGEPGAGDPSQDRPNRIRSGTITPDDLAKSLAAGADAVINGRSSKDDTNTRNRVGLRR